MSDLLVYATLVNINKKYELADNEKEALGIAIKYVGELVKENNNNGR